jgi:two-component system, cell cycle response regulator
LATTTTPYHVLLIEEDPKQTELYADLIREVANCKVDVMSRVESSFDWIGRSNYHLVVIDSTTTSSPSGGMNGLTLVEQIKRVSPVTSVILVSEQATIEQAVAAVRLGAEDYLKKPFNLETFKLAVKRGLDRKMIFGENTGASSFLNLLNSCQMISASLEENKIFWVIQSYLLRELKSSHSAIYTLNDSEPMRIDEATNDGRRDRAMEEILDIALHASNPLLKMVEGGESVRLTERGQLTPGLFIFRFKCAGPADYFCVLLSPDKTAINEAFESKLRMLKAQIEVTGKNIEQYLGVQQLVYVDDATGLYNTRYLNYILEREISHANATKRSFAVLFMDCDKFKSINDGHGHLIGTKLLHELGEELKKYVRRTDTVFRYGGDEFVAVLAPCDLATAKVVAERIRDAVERRTFCAEEGLNLKFTVSIGLALFPEHANTKKTIIEAADHAMYDAKKTTRNRVTVSDGKPAAELPAAQRPDRTALEGASAYGDFPLPAAEVALAAAKAEKAITALKKKAPKDHAASAAAHVAAVISGEDDDRNAEPQSGAQKAKPAGRKGSSGGR